MWKLTIASSFVFALFALPSVADTTSQQWMTIVEVKKTGDHCVNDSNCFNRYHPNIPAVATANVGDMIVLHTRDALDSEFTIDSVPADLATVDLGLVHPMTGPVSINGAKRGDAIEVEIVDIAPDQYGYTVIAPGFGFLRDIFTEPYIVNWHLTRTGAVSPELSGVTVPYEAFPGSIGVMPGEPEIQMIKAREADLAGAGGVVLGPSAAGALPASVCGESGSHKDDCLRTIPPRENGGNMDVQQMQVGTRVLFPCFIDGCGVFAGDIHYAQGDGEVSGTAVEMGTVTTLRVKKIHKGKGSSMDMPATLGNDQIIDMEPTRFYQTVGIPKKGKGEIPPSHGYLGGEKIANLENLNEDLTVAARHALLQMIDYLVSEHGLTKEQAYVLCSVAVDLRVGQVVDVPNYVVTAVLNLDVFDKYRF
ncbi:MAG TPA: formamidase [Gammaproteobacteria bacterium]|jgi:formamidase|nr:acetamidase/formamidase family protein [Arenicellales bacterium]MDP6550570.1 acetamidase/formamidase family protein [Arenicellales bacterium]MDP6917645.1 acetamidase/formamidase family protein [Arenicellales bacterium]HCX87948.1 formamidase [Gammaproteobacteria bacterium]|tara:strand:+ start:4342 stop:5601 length:1260 start_codon:yes stop_codon:yes gene_type:complete